MRTKITSVYDLSKQEYAAQVDLAARTAAPIFRLFGWTWAPIARVPDEVDIKNDLDDKICRLLNHKKLLGVNSGRLRVSRSCSSPTGFCIDLGVD